MIYYREIRATKLLYLITFFLIGISIQGWSQSSAQPNILIILADDLGYGDLKPYNRNSLIPTPNLNRLADESIRLTNAYCPVAVCSPSRYSLMTGQYAFRSWKKSGVMRNYERSMIDANLLTLPEMLQKAGYTTAGFGKWHLGTTFPTLDGKNPVGYGQFRDDNNGANLDLSRPVSDGPLDHGFDYWLGFSCASECWILENNQIMGAIQHDLYTIEAAQNTETLEKYSLEEYLPYVTNNALSYLEEQASQDKEQPFFLYYAPYVPHIPLAVNESFQGKTDAGLYGDYVYELDHYIGQILDALDRLALTDNTLVLFASDNGSQFVVTARDMDLENASNSPENVQDDNSSGEVHHPNGPLRGTKWTAWEGGVRTPLIARWPGHFPATQSSDQFFALNDVLATLASVVDYELPDDSGRDSYNLLPVLMGKEPNTRETVVVESSGGRMGLRWGKWKFLAPDKKNPDGELYDLSTDLSESINLAKNYPEEGKKMQQKLNDILKSERSATHP
ncbi:MAG: arylsulfatase [Cyclobacteriaceae bacterium]